MTTSRIIILFACAAALSGCDLLGLFMPYRRTTEVEAAQAMKRCGGLPEAVSGWRVTKDGALALGRDTPDTPITPSFDSAECIVEWARDNRVEIRMVGWEVSKR